ncbi:Endopolyphosphatase [Vermiconidia calcicola]|uniref:Endopolyphosphatase n=1 Tax=Vermiconidia calcicola TaxID=1690605 RepID=A0ACC3NG87_9PEZI|nr:Endopolyphosphatase [Vermiconidia calcicola]
MGLIGRICLFAPLVGVLTASPVQIPLQDPGSQDASVLQHLEKKRTLQGRFLHITDFHPDQFYEVYSSTADDYACHGGEGPAGIYGAETSDCDSPISLINKTMDWIGKALRDKVDFVIWTGDSARHDNDEDIPRTEKQVVGLNQLMVDKMFETFGKHNGDEGDENPNNDYVIPIVPNLGNNDILPHNIFRKGPDKWTRTYGKIWKSFIPEEQKHQFEQGGWFYVEVIPNKLAVFSLNTLYFFTSNAAADGCAIHSEPGYRQMEWLRIQLQFMRDRGMKAMLTGHVPPVHEPSKTGWDETCWQKYTLWLRQYRDVIDFKQIEKETKHGRMPAHETESTDDDLHAAVSANYFIDLRDGWSRLPHPPKSMRWVAKLEQGLAELYESEHPYLHLKDILVDILESKKKKKKKQKRKEKERKYLKEMGGEFAERFAASFVSASVVPNLYPTLRVFEYNITGLDEHSSYHGIVPPRVDEDSDLDAERSKRNKKNKFTVPKPPSKSAPPGPAYSPQTLSLVRFTQYLANLTRINNDFESLSSGSDTRNDELTTAKWKPGKHDGKPLPDKDYQPDPKKFKYEVHYDTKHDDVYRLKDLTMPNIVDLARRIGSFEGKAAVEAEEDPQGCQVESAGDIVEVEKKKKHKKKHKKKKKKHQHRKVDEAWYTFVRRAYVETLDPDELEEEFGR